MLRESLKRERQVTKVLSSSIECFGKVRPSWASDTLLNYMSAYDFATYDIDDESVSIIERPQNPHLLVSVKFSHLIGDHIMRAIYLVKTPQGYEFQIIPSLNPKEPCLTKKAQHSKISVEIETITDFIYLSECNRVLFPVKYKEPAWPPFGLVCFSLTNYQCSIFASQDPIISILETKHPFFFALACEHRVDLIKLDIAHNGEMKLIKKQKIMKNFHWIVSLGLMKPYLCIYDVEKTMHLYEIDDSDLVKVHEYNCSKICDIEVGGITANRTSIFIWQKYQPIFHHYLVDEASNTISYFHQIVLSPMVVRIKSLTLSETNRNCLIISTNAEGQITEYLIFKLQMSIELKIPDVVLYLKPMKYFHKPKRVNKLAIPKINNTVYALSGTSVHNLQKQHITGVLSFDIHPLGFFMAVSYSFNIKIYSVQCESMTLLYSFSMHGIKKVVFTADGSSLVLFSQKKIRILNSYTFQERFEHREKNSNIVDVIYGQHRFVLYTLFDNGTVVERSLITLQKTNVIRFFAQTNKKIVGIRVFERQMIIFGLIEDGSLLIKKVDEIMGGEYRMVYEDREKITEIQIDEKNKIIFCGTTNGLVRLHELQSAVGFQINSYKEIKAGYREISALVPSPESNSLFIGNVSGDITQISYSEDKYSQANQNLSVGFHTLNFLLISLSKSQTNSEKNALETKLQNLVYRMQKHIEEYRGEVVDEFDRQIDLYQIENDCNGDIYRECKEKIDKIFKEKNRLKVQTDQKKLIIILNYEKKIKQCIQIHYELLEEKNALKKKYEEEKYELMKFLQGEKSLQKEELEKKTEQISLSIKKTEYSSIYQDQDQDENTFQMNGRNQLRVSLSNDLNKAKQKCFQLNKNNGYLETAKKNMLSRRVQEQTLQYRIKQELKMLNETNSQQGRHISYLMKDLKNTEQLIHRIQNQVKNTPNNVISSDKADSDLCSYKIWMKDKVQSEVFKLEDMLNTLNDRIQKKSQQLVFLTLQKKSKEDKISNLNDNYDMKKQKYKKIQEKIWLIKSLTINLHKNTSEAISQKYENGQQQIQLNFDKIREIVSMQRVNEKTIYFMQKNMKIHERKLKNFGQNNSELLSEYENLMFENKLLKDKQVKMKEEIKKIKGQMNEERKQNKQNQNGILTTRTTGHTVETPFIKYLRNKSKKTKQSLSSFLQTAVSTPRFTYRRRNMHTSRKI